MTRSSAEEQMAELRGHIKSRYGVGLDIPAAKRQE